MYCREICSKFKVKRSDTKIFGRYNSGQKRCSSCVIYINWDGTRCPCCGHILRTKPRNSSGHNKLFRNIIYKKFQFKLKLSQHTIDYVQRLHDEQMKKGLIENESPYLIVATCIFIVSRITEPSKSLREISEVAHIKEDDLRQCYEMVFDEIEDSLKGISQTLN